MYAAVASIGADAFRGCTKLAHIDLFGDPSRLNWADDSNPFTQQVTCHIQPAYESQLETLQARYQDKHIKFEANLYYDNSMLENNVKRNIKGYIAQENINILGGAAPFVVVGTFSGAKKSVTHGSNGFASCVKIGDTYYVHTNNNSRSLNQATMNSLTGVVTSLSQTDHPTLKLQTTYEYVGSNIVKLIYTLKNEGGTPIDNVMLGGTGDIKIGADDYAMKPHAIESDYPDMTAVPENSGLQYYNTSLLFLTKTGLRQYYQVTDQAKFDALSNRAAFKQNGTLYYLEVEEIPAFELNDKQTFTVGGQTYAYSALDYAMKLQEKPQASMQNLGTALYWYYDAANTYFSGLTA